MREKALGTLQRHGVRAGLGPARGVSGARSARVAVGTGGGRLPALPLRGATRRILPWPTSTPRDAACITASGSRSSTGSANSAPRPVPATPSMKRFACSWPVDHRVIQRILEVAELSVPFRDPAVGCVAHRQTAERRAGRQARARGLHAIEMIRGGFFRNRGAYLVGRLVLNGNEYKPFVIALLNEPDGVRGRSGAARGVACAQSVQLRPRRRAR